MSKLKVTLPSSLIKDTLQFKLTNIRSSGEYLVVFAFLDRTS